VKERRRSKANKRWQRQNGKVRRIRRKKPSGKPMPERTAQANAGKARVRARAKHVFAHQKNKMVGLLPVWRTPR